LAGRLRPEDIAVKLYKINYDSIGIKNPIENVRFYSKENPNKSFKMAREEVSMMTPQRFEEYILRVFIKSPERTKKKRRALPSRPSARRNSASSLPS